MTTKTDTNLMIHNVDTTTARRFRVLAAEHGLTQAGALEWLMAQAGVFVKPVAKP